MNRSVKLAAAAAWIVVASLAHAQVHKCVDSAGRTIFSDAPCPSSAIKSDRVMGRSATTSEELPEGQRLQEQIDSANRAAALKRAQVYGDSPVQAQQGSGKDAVILDDRRSDAEDERYRRMLKNMNGGRGPTKAQMDMLMRRPQSSDGARVGGSAQPAPPAGPSALVNCDPAGCWDTQGRRYNNAAGGFARNDGKFCTQAGPQNVVCN